MSHNSRFTEKEIKAFIKRIFLISLALARIELSISSLYSVPELLLQHCNHIMCFLHISKNFEASIPKVDAQAYFLLYRIEYHLVDPLKVPLATGKERANLIMLNRTLTILNVISGNAWQRSS